ncbi:MAG: hypothetical protein IKI23_12760 [Lachnospiraceae bacterium]|nr:hypothetical protein [Lachnospiraceae bacterium]
MKIRNRFILLALTGIMLSLSACSYIKGYPDTNTVEFLRNGSLRETSVEEFPPEEYDMSDLKDVILSSVNSYNEAHEGAVSIDLYDVRARKVRLVMTYKDPAAYEDFNTQPIYAGPAGDYEKEIPQEASFSKVKDDLSLKSLNKQPDFKDLTLYVVTNPVDVAVSGRIEYVSGDVELTGPSSCRAGENISETNPAYIAARSN